ncbi:MAG TPA: hypothetical protein VFX49_05875, partial [Chloroflexota bacterium]|nr:hypothetical protein [Chloroflexota bacterium]
MPPALPPTSAPSQPHVTTVLGPVPAAALGATMAHEHVFFDLRCYFTQSEDDPTGAESDAPIAPDRLWWLRTHPMNSRPNLVQEDLDLATAEVALFQRAGGGTLVDVTSVGIAPHPAELAEVSRRTGVHIVAGTGFYVAGSYPADVADWPESQLEDHFRRELEDGIGAGMPHPISPRVTAAQHTHDIGSTRVRAGLIGELGVGNPASAGEQRMLRAAARVQR